jgi:hypothetical protein
MRHGPEPADRLRLRWTEVRPPCTHFTTGRYAGAIIRRLHLLATGLYADICTGELAEGGRSA